MFTLHLEKKKQRNKELQQEEHVQSVDEPFHDAETDLSFSTEI